MGTPERREPALYLANIAREAMRHDDFASENQLSERFLGGESGIK